MWISCKDILSLSLSLSLYYLSVYYICFSLSISALSLSLLILARLKTYKDDISQGFFEVLIYLWKLWHWGSFKLTCLTHEVSCASNYDISFSLLGSYLSRKPWCHIQPLWNCLGLLYIASDFLTIAKWHKMMSSYQAINVPTYLSTSVKPHLIICHCCCLCCHRNSWR